jgi:hypothetical protein
VAGLSLALLLRESPDITVRKVEILTHLGRAHEEGVHFIPTLVSGEKKLSGVYLTKKKIQKFLESL